VRDLSRDNLPAGWEVDVYANVINKISTNGKKITQKQYLAAGKYPVIDQGRDEVSGFCSDEEKVIFADFPVLIFGDHTRYVKLVNEPFVPGADGIKVLQPMSALDTKLIYYFTQYLAISIKNKGYARHYQWIAQELIGIPPEKEQIRIVDKIEELFSELDKGIESLKTAKAQLAVYRQALLKHAFEGKLTEQWRRDNTDKLESPEQLLARIQQEREARYKQQLDDWKKAVSQWEFGEKEGKKPSKPKGFKTYPPVDIDETANLSELPGSWRWERLGNLINGSAQNGVYKPSTSYGRGHYIVRIDDFYDGNLVKKDDFKRLELTEDELKTYSLEANDILINRVNSIEYLGKCCEIPELDEPIVFESNIMKFKILNSFLKGNYLTPYLSSFSGKSRICRNAKHAVNQASINQTDVSMTPIPLCDIEEQDKITAILDYKLSVVGAELSNIDMSLKKAAVLRQSILTKAFLGQLVSQDPSDEPASELLKKWN
jgi:type I restriction enzyme S subunit